jgi:hypothetical protein
MPSIGALQYYINVYDIKPVYTWRKQVRITFMRKHSFHYEYETLNVWLWYVYLASL